MRRFFKRLGWGIVVCILAFSMIACNGNEESNEQKRKTDSALDERLNRSENCFSVAEQCFEEEDYANAIKQYDGVIEEDSNYSKAQKHRAEAVEEYRTERMSNAEKKAEEENYQGAVDILTETLEIIPGDSTVEYQLALYQDRCFQQKRAENHKSAELLAQQRQYLDAIDTLDQFMESNGEDAETKSLRQKFFDAYVEEVFAQVEARMNAGDYAGAVSELSKGHQYAPDDARINDKYNEIDDWHINKVIKDAEDKAGKNEYMQAVRLLEIVLDQHKNDVRITEKINEITDRYIAFVTANADAFVQQTQYAEALKEIEAALKDYPKEQRLLNKKSELTDSYARSASEAADKALKEKGYEAAMEIVNTALKSIPDNSLLKDKHTELTAYLPIEFFSLAYFNSDGNYSVSNAFSGKDNLGNTQSNSYTLSNYRKNSWGEYKIDGQYGLLKGTFYLNYSDRATKDTSEFSVYGDGELLYTGTVTNGVNPIDFSINIEGVQKLKISVYNSRGTTNVGSLSNVFIQKMP